MKIALLAGLLVVIAGCSTPETDYLWERYPDFDDYDMALTVSGADGRELTRSSGMYIASAGDVIQAKVAWIPAPPPNAELEIVCRERDRAILQEISPGTWRATGPGAVIIQARCHRGDPWGWVATMGVEIR